MVVHQLEELFLGCGHRMILSRLSIFSSSYADLLFTCDAYGRYRMHVMLIHSRSGGDDRRCQAAPRNSVSTGTKCDI